MDNAPVPSLQDLQAPEVKYKDRKILMHLYDGKLKNPEKLRRLIKLGYVTVRDGEYVPTIVGALLIDFTVKERNKADARRKAKSRKPNRKDGGTAKPQNESADHGTLSDGELGIRDSGEAGKDTELHIGETV